MLDRIFGQLQRNTIFPWSFHRGQENFGHVKFYTNSLNFHLHMNWFEVPTWDFYLYK